MFDDFSAEDAYDPYFDDASDLGDDGGTLEEYPAYGAEPDIGDDHGCVGPAHDSDSGDDGPGPSLRTRLRAFGPHLDDPIGEGTWKYETQDHLLGLVLSSVADGRLGEVAASCAEGAEHILLEAQRATGEDHDSYGMRVTAGRRSVLWTRAFDQLFRVQRRLRECRDEAHVRTQTAFLPAQRRRNLEKARKNIEDHCAPVRQYITTVLLEVDKLDPWLAAHLFARSRPEVLESVCGNFAAAPAREAGARSELRGATQGSIGDQTATHNCVDPSEKETADGEGFLKTPALLQAGAPLCGEHSLSEAVSHAPAPAKTESPPRARKGRNARRNAKKTAQKGLDDEGPGENA